MAYLYYIIMMISLLIYTVFFVFYPGKALFTGLVFTTFVPNVLPWFIIPIRELPVLTHMIFIGLSLCYYIIQVQRGLIKVYKINVYNLALLVFLCVLCGYLFISDNQGYGVLKTGLFFLRGILVLVALRAFGFFDEEKFIIFIFVILFGSLLMALAVFSLADLTAPRSVISDKTSPISIGRVIGMGATLTLIILLTDDQFNIRKKIFLLGLSSILLFATLLTGSRGPVFGVFFSLLGVFMFIQHGIQERKNMLQKIMIIFGIFLVLIIGVLEINKYGGIDRLVNRTNTIGDNNSDRNRLHLYQMAWNGFIESGGWGIGTGNFAELLDTTGREYPHNLVLEVAVEQGWSGLGVLLILLFLSFKRILRVSYRYHLNPNKKAVLGLWFFMLFNAMVSGDIAHNYLLWVTSGMMWLILPVEKKCEEYNALYYQYELP